jgi:hypothetical protein
MEQQPTDLTRRWFGLAALSGALANGVSSRFAIPGRGIDPEHVECVFEAQRSLRDGDGAGDLPVHHRCPWGRLWADGNEPRAAIFQFTLPGAENELTNAEPREGAV